MSDPVWKPGAMGGLIDRLERIRDLFEQISELAIQKDKEQLEKIVQLNKVKYDLAEKQINNSNL